MKDRNAAKNRLHALLEVRSPAATKSTAQPAHKETQMEASPMHKMLLGSWRFESGNACHATLELTRPSGLTIGFTWKTSLIDADRDRYLCEILPEALRLAVHEVDGLADITKICR